MSKENKQIVVEANLSIKPKNLQKIVPKALASLSEEEAVERHTIGEYNRKRTKDEGVEKEG